MIMTNVYTVAFITIAVSFVLGYHSVTLIKFSIPGAASKAILKAAGDNIQTECRRGGKSYI